MVGFKVDEIKIEFNEQRHMPVSFAVGSGNVKEIKVLENGVEIVEADENGTTPAIFYPTHVIFKLLYFVDL